MIKFLTLSLLLLMHPSGWPQGDDVSELGRSLANYQACSKVATRVNDAAMFSYYQNMFNDAAILTLSINTKEANQLYSTWEKSEKVLSGIEDQSMLNICLSRFDALSRNMVDKIATQ